MGALLEAVATAVPEPGHAASSTRLAADAARLALARGGRRPGDVDLLVNAGVYRDRNVMEPANATFIQHLIGANLGWGSTRGRGTLSFDVVNGAAGVLSALRVADGFVATGGATTGLVVTSDADPGGTRGWDIDPMGAALLLSPGPPGVGFEAFDEQTYPQYAGLRTSGLRWTGSEQVLEIAEAPEFGARALECAADAVVRFLDKQGRDPAEVDLVVGWPSPDALAAALRERLGFTAGQAPGLAGPQPRAYTAGIALALETATTTPRYASARLVLLIAVGAGITVATALYRRPEE